MTKSEYCKTCSKCRKRKRSRVYYRLREGKTVWLCQGCWDEEERLYEYRHGAKRGKPGR